jgi:hypothetical protein
MEGSAAMVGGYYAAGTEYEIDIARYMVRGLSFQNVTEEVAVTVQATFVIDESTLWGTGDILPPGVPRTRPWIPPMMPKLYGMDVVETDIPPGP